MIISRNVHYFSQLLMKPIKYRLLLGQLSPTQNSSLKVLASIMLYIGRRAAKTIPQILVCNEHTPSLSFLSFSLQALPHELALSLHSDADIQAIVENAEIKSILTTCEVGYFSLISLSLFLFINAIDSIKLSLRVWCEEYIRRIDGSFARELRT